MARFQPEGGIRTSASGNQDTDRPGENELVRRVLGHKSIQTTINFYCSLETTHASQIFTDIVRQRLDFEGKVA